MVFTGRPSAGCATCKQRKKKCDLTKPFCKQCTSTGKQCPGVPNEIDTLFRNVTPATAEIHLNKKQRVTFENTTRHSHDEEQTNTSIVQTIPTDWLQVATTSYFNQHSSGSILVKQNGPYFELLSQFYASSTSNSALNYAVTALAVSHMAADLHIYKLKIKANVAYGKALRAINCSLADPRESRKNEVIVGIFALISFELKQQEPNLLARYEAHVEGMKNLLLLRGYEQLQDPQSSKVFRTLRSQIIYDHIIRKKALIYVDNDSIWIDASPQDSPSDHLHTIAARIPSLLAQTTSLVQMNTGEHPYSLISDVLAIKCLLDQWFETWQTIPLYKDTLVDSHNFNAWNGRVHVFTDFPTAILSNSYHFLQLQCLGILSTALIIQPNGDTKTELKLSEIQKEVQNSVDNICYTTSFIVNQLLDQGLQKNGSQIQLPVYPCYGEANWILLPIVGAYIQSTISKSQTVWLKQQLSHLNADLHLLSALQASLTFSGLNDLLDRVCQITDYSLEV